MLVVVLQLFLCVGLSLGSPSSYITKACTTNAIPFAALYPGYCAFEWLDDVKAPRSIRSASNNDVLYVSSTEASVYVAWENENGTVSRTVLVSGYDLNHGLAINGNYLYASRTSQVMRWPYTSGTRTKLTGMQIVVKGMPCCSDHLSRTIEFDKAGNMYVHSGSSSNVDPNPSKAMIRRFTLPAKLPTNGIAWSSGYAYARGLRNEVGIRFDPNGVLWGVENGRDDLARADLGNVAQLNPSEELNKFANPGAFYGYPYCWSEYQLLNSSFPKGTQWADAKFWKDGTHTDSWCRNAGNVVPPVYNFDAHKAPLDILFNHGDNSFAPNITDGYAFVAFHGSTRRTVPVGYSVSLIEIANGLPVAEIPFFRFAGPGVTGTNWPYRPVGLAFHMCGGVHPCLLVTTGTRSGAPGAIVAILRNE